MDAVAIFCFLSVLLVLGKLIRLGVPVLQRLYLPSSVIGGLLGLLVLSFAGKYFPADMIKTMGKLPGFLINVIFAAIFLGTVTPKLKEIFKMALPQLCMGQMLAWGQYVIGLGLAGFLLLPVFGVNVAMGNLLEIGFEGGHGTVGGMSQTFLDFKWEEGIALGYTVATGGMILGILIGMMLINWALNKGHINSVRTFSERNRSEQIGIYQADERPSAGKQTVFCDSIDSLAWHIALLGISILIGYGMLKGLQYGEVALFPENKTRLFTGFPLFPLCMIGGVLVQLLFQKMKVNYLIDHGQMQRLSGASLDFLVVAAVATIRLEVVAANWLPLTIMMAVGLLWSVFLLMFVAPRLFKSAWFECAIAEFGQGLGVTATGLMLLRTVDPENKTVAAASFGYKQLIHEPIMGGGLWTALALTLVFTIGWLPVWCFSLVMLLVWIGISAVIIKRNRKK
ncbi:MAG: sodium:glutamate symporter [Lentisphaerae bacterium]|nr:sodium:glutamate symporter [Lentisphaerota bacterium]